MNLLVVSIFPNKMLLNAEIKLLIFIIIIINFSQI